MTARTLVLDQGYQPHRIVSWRRAVTMLFAGKVEVVEEYDEEIRSVTISIKMPAVVRLIRKATGRPPKVRFSRINIMARDNFRCQYCGKRGTRGELNLDHVLPRAQGGTSRWENIATSCIPCNTQKGNRTPEQAGMKLRKQPRRPHSLPELTIRLEYGDSIPDAWASYCYWNLSIEEGS